jgi:cytochrome c oxidase subunit IV
MLTRLFLGSPNARLQRSFADQFTPDGDAYLFRRGMRGAAVRVTARERDAFVADYAQISARLRWSLMAGLIAAMILIVGLSVALKIDADSRLFSVITYGLIIAIGAVFVGLQMRAYYEPGRALDHRMTVSGALSRAETSRAMLKRTDWRQIVVLPLIGAGLIVTNWPHRHEPGSWFWLAMGVIMVPLGILAAVRKWRVAHSGDR